MNKEIQAPLGAMTAENVNELMKELKDAPAEQSKPHPLNGIKFPLRVQEIAFHPSTGQPPEWNVMDSMGFTLLKDVKDAPMVGNIISLLNILFTAHSSAAAELHKTQGLLKETMAEVQRLEDKITVLETHPIVIFDPAVEMNKDMISMLPPKEGAPLAAATNTETGEPLVGGQDQPSAGQATGHKLIEHPTVDLQRMTRVNPGEGAAEHPLLTFKITGIWDEIQAYHERAIEFLKMQWPAGTHVAHRPEAPFTYSRDWQGDPHGSSGEHNCTLCSGGAMELVDNRKTTA